MCVEDTTALARGERAGGVSLRVILRRFRRGGEPPRAMRCVGNARAPLSCAPPVPRGAVLLRCAPSGALGVT